MGDASTHIALLVTGLPTNLNRSAAVSRRIDPVEPVSLQQPKFRNDARDDVTVIKDTHDRALGNDHGNGARVARYGSAGHVAAAQTQGQVDPCGRCVYVSGGREEDAVFGDDEGAVKLGQFFRCLARL